MQKTFTLFLNMPVRERCFRIYKNNYSIDILKKKPVYILNKSLKPLCTYMRITLFIEILNRKIYSCTMGKSNLLILDGLFMLQRRKERPCVELWNIYVQK